jgi:hypothetical protein
MVTRTVTRTLWSVVVAAVLVGYAASVSQLAANGIW